MWEFGGLATVSISIHHLSVHRKIFARLKPCCVLRKIFSRFMCFISHSFVTCVPVNVVNFTTGQLHNTTLGCVLFSCAMNYVVKENTRVFFCT